MGNDTPLAVLSDRHRRSSRYFKQLFAQVTNPPIDPIRETLVMSLGTCVGPSGNLLDETPEHAHQLAIEHPILLERGARAAASGESARICQAADARHHVAGRRGSGRRSRPRSTRSAARPTPSHRRRHEHADPQRPRRRARIARRSRRCCAVGAVHHHLVREGTRMQAGLVARDRRAARGAPRRAADRLRRGRGQPVPGVRVARRAGRPRARSRRRRTSRRPSRTSSRHREGPAQDRSPRWGSRRSRATTARRSSRRSGSKPRSSTATSRHAVADRRRRPRRARARDAATSTLAPTRDAHEALLPSAASTPGAATASTTCGTRRRSRCSSRRCATAARSPTPSTRGSSTRTRRGAATLRGLLRVPRAAEHERSRSTRSSRRGRSSRASRPARCRSARSRARRTRRWRSR